MAIVIGFDGRFLQNKFDGIGRYAHGLLSAMGAVDGDHTVRVFVDPSLPNSRYPLQDLVGADRLELHEVSTPLYRPRELWEWSQVLRRHPVDVFHAPYFWSPLLLPCPLVLTVHDMIFDRHPEYIPGRRFRIPYVVASRLMLNKARNIIADSQATRQDITELAGIPENTVTVIPLGVERRFCPLISDRQKDQIRHKYALPSAYILAVGARRPHKNIARLVTAFESIATSVPHALVLVGAVDTRVADAATPALARLKARGRALEIDQASEADLPAIYAMADLLVQPSLIEGFGLPVLEAMASGCPVACSRIPSLLEVVGDAAFSFDPHSESDIADVLQRLLSSTECLDELRSAGLDRARTFTWENAAARTLDVYRAAA
jgi:glycosyltransferase involved in cell wall biosynthesis